MSNTNDNTKNIRRRSLLALVGQIVTTTAETAATTAETSLVAAKVVNNGLKASQEFLEKDAGGLAKLAWRSIRELRLTTEYEQKKNLREEYNLNKDILEMSDKEFFDALEAKENKNQEQKPETPAPSNSSSEYITKDELNKLLTEKYSAFAEDFKKLFEAEVAKAEAAERKAAAN